MPFRVTSLSAGRAVLKAATKTKAATNTTREPVPAGKDSLIASLRKQLAEEKGKKEGK
jgi:hypothetical protein